MPLALILAFLLAASAQSSHTVSRGENLWKIAGAYGTTPQAIAEANQLPDPNLILTGQILVIPVGAESDPAVPRAEPGATHTVAPGENLSRIAGMYGTSVQVLVEANGITRPNLIHPGQVLEVPGGTLGVEELMTRYAQQFGVKPALIKGLAWQESGWRQDLVSKAGAIGVMQLMPYTADFTARILLGHPVDPNDLEQNIKAGVRFFAYLMHLTGGDERLAVAGYFQGLRSVNANGPSPRTQRYVNNVMALKERYGG